jgi:hypothetical protein
MHYETEVNVVTAKKYAWEDVKTLKVSLIECESKRIHRYYD